MDAFVASQVQAGAGGQVPACMTAAHPRSYCERARATCSVVPPSYSCLRASREHARADKQHMVTWTAVWQGFVEVEPALHMMVLTLLTLALMLVAIAASASGLLPAPPVCAFPWERAHCTGALH